MTYTTTLRHWVRNLEANWEAAIREGGLERVRLWRLFLSGSAHGFATGRLSVHQSLLAKPVEAGRVTLPLPEPTSTTREREKRKEG